MEDKSLNGLNTKLISDPDEIREKYLTFWSDNQLYAVPILHVEQIVEMQDITLIPDFVDCVRGVINMRGTIIPVLDFQLCMNKEEKAYSEHTCIIVMNTQEANKYLGYIVDGVEEVIDITADQITQPPDMEKRVENNLVAGIIRQNCNGSERLILYVDPVKVSGVVMAGIDQIASESGD